MKFDKWTLGLAAVGLVSLASAAKAADSTDTANTVLTSLSATTLSGYVDTSAQWNFGHGNAFPPPVRFNQGKQDGFNLNVVQLSLTKPLDEREWASGYRVDLWAGPDANALATQSSGNASDFGIRQAYVALRTPVGNGIDWKFGVFDSIIGYESIASPNDPNYTRSYGNSIEPQTHTGILGTYRVNDNVALSFGVANTANSAINSRAQNGSSGMVNGPFGAFWSGLYANASTNAGGFTGLNARAESYKSYMGSLALTAPDSMGFLSGSTLYAGAVSGFNNSVLGSGIGNSQVNAYVGATIATPVTGLRFGAAFDYFGSEMNQGVGSGNVTAEINAYSPAIYMSYQATEKLSLHARGEYLQSDLNGSVAGNSTSANVRIWALTATAQYDLWENVLSRLEFRWDHNEHGDFFGGTSTTTGPELKNAFMLAANVIYKF
jgi:hypothetical protein